MLVRYVALGLPSWLLGLAIVQAGECDCCGTTAHSRRPSAQCFNETTRCDQASRGRPSPPCDARLGCDEAPCGARAAFYSDGPCCTDSGLLDAVDQFAGRIQYGLIHFSRKFRSGIRSDRDWRSRSACDASCDSCCDSCCDGKSVPRIEESTASPPVSGNQSQHTKSRLPPTRTRVPDAEINPFEDDSQTNLRPLPIKNNRYQRLMPTNAAKAEPTSMHHFDAQASRSLSTAEFWADSGLPDQQPIPQITTASSESSAQAIVLRKPYRVRVSDQETTSESQENSNSLSTLRSTETNRQSGTQAPSAQNKTSNPLR